VASDQADRRRLSVLRDGKLDDFWQTTTYYLLCRCFGEGEGIMEDDRGPCFVLSFTGSHHDNAPLGTCFVGKHAAGELLMLLSLSLSLSHGTTTPARSRNLSSLANETRTHRTPRLLLVRSWRCVHLHSVQVQTERLEGPETWAW
jgi:hypothetical protein